MKLAANASRRVVEKNKGGGGSTDPVRKDLCSEFEELAKKKDENKKPGKSKKLTKKDIEDIDTQTIDIQPGLTPYILRHKAVEFDNMIHQLKWV